MTINHKNRMKELNRFEHLFIKDREEDTEITYSCSRRHPMNRTNEWPYPEEEKDLLVSFEYKEVDKDKKLYCFKCNKKIGGRDKDEKDKFIYDEYHRCQHCDQNYCDGCAKA